MVTNADRNETSLRLADNLQWVFDNVDNYFDHADVIFVMGHGRLVAVENIQFYNQIASKKQNEWAEKFFVYARRSASTGLTKDIGGLRNFHELRVGSGWPIIDVQIQTSEKKDDANIMFRPVKSDSLNDIN